MPVTRAIVASKPSEIPSAGLSPRARELWRASLDYRRLADQLAAGAVQR